MFVSHTLLRCATILLYIQTQITRCQYTPESELLRLIQKEGKLEIKLWIKQTVYHDSLTATLVYLTIRNR